MDSSSSTSASMKDSVPVQRQSPLLTLLPEIRSIILEYALVAEKPIVTFPLDEFQREDYQEAFQPSSLTVCRQFRREGLPIYYSCNEFILHTEGVKAIYANQWLNRVQPHLAEFRKVVFWLRYSTIFNPRATPLGLLGVAMQFAPRRNCWVVSPEWRWITVFRRPYDAESDGKYLVNELQNLVVAKARGIDPKCYADLMTKLNESYKSYKASQYDPQ